MNHFASTYTSEPLTETGVYPAAGQWEGKFVAHIVSESGGTATGLYDTREEAEAYVVETQEFHARFWNEKVTWANWGDRTSPNRAFRDCLRIEGRHYIPRQLGLTGPAPFKGFGGRTLRWVYLDDPTGFVYESDDVMTQGAIPSGMADVLPDNAAWVKAEQKRFDL